ncbi:MAG: oxidoreductase [Planctomycetaceae bacterium]|nr:oxidoreductase [Planctomycetaceae bacterium]
MAKTIGVGVIGMGWMGSVHSRSYRAVPDRFADSGLKPRLVICADEVESRAQQGAKQFGFDACTTDWKQVIAHPDVDAINIAAPNNQHVEIATAAAQAGKHIFCEKPVGRSPQETAAIAAAAHKAGAITGVGYNYRWAPVVQYALQLIRDGALGQLTHYRGRFLVDYGSDPHGVLSWRFRRELAGMGTLTDLMSHAVDMAHMLVGPIQRVVGQHKTFITERPLVPAGSGTHFSRGDDKSPTGPVTNEDYVGVLAQFQSGVVGTFETCRVIKGHGCEMAFELNGTKGALKWNFERMNELQLHLPDDNPAHDGFQILPAAPNHPGYARFNPGPAISMSYEDLKVIEAYQFANSIANRRQGQPGFAEAVAVAEVQDAVARSWQTDRWEDVTPIPST